MIVIVSGLLTKARNNPDYVGAVVTGYLFIAFNIVLQIVLVPLYLEKLGTYRFGVLMMLLSLINFLMVGIYGFSGSASRVLGEHAVAGDDKRFAESYGLARTLFAIYSVTLAVIVIGVGVVFDRQLFGPIRPEYAFDVHASLVLLAVYLVLFLEFGLNRLALLAKKRQTQANCLQIFYYIVFGASVVPWLLMGGGMAGVLGCLILSVIAARILSWKYGRAVGIGPVPWIWPTKAFQPVLRRFIGPLGVAYFIYGVLFIFLQTDVLVVGWLAGPDIAGRYVLVWKIAEVIVLMLWRVPEHLQSEFIRMDAQNDRARLERVYRHGLVTVRIAAMVAGIGYALVGPWLVRLWVGVEHAPTDRWAFALAGAAIFWLATARMPATYAYAVMRLKPLLRVAALEVFGKLVLILILFPTFGYLAPLIAINAVHICGVAWMYVRLGRTISSRPTGVVV